MRETKSKNKSSFFLFLLKSFIYLIVIVVTGFISFYLLEYFHFDLDHEATKFFLEEYTRITILSTIVIIILQLPILIISGSLFVFSFMSILITLFLSFVNWQKMIYRPEPLFPSDVHMIKDFQFLFGQIAREQQILLVVVSILFINVILYFCIRAFKKKKEKTKNWILKVILLFVSFLMYKLYFAR